MRRLLCVLAVSAAVVLSGSPARAADAEDLYKAKCQMCHGADGKGDTAAGKKLGAHDFGAADVMKMTDAELTDVINKGKNKMPGYAAKLKPEQVKMLVAHVRELGKKK